MKKALWFLGGLLAASILVNILTLGLLFIHPAHGGFHAKLDDRGHRGINAVDEAHRQVLIGAFAESGTGVIGRFKIEAADQVLLDDGETVLNVLDRQIEKEPGRPGSFVSIPIDPKKIPQLGDKLFKQFKDLGDDIEAWDRLVDTPKGQVAFRFIHSLKLDTTIVLRPPTSELGDPKWIPLAKPATGIQGGA